MSQRSEKYARNMERRAAGITSTDYSDAVLAAMEDWECTVNAWNGQ